MRAILVSVDFGDILSITLPFNLHHFEEVLVVSTPDDHETRAVVNRHQCRLFATSAFYDNGADFNKWKALELGLDHFGRTGWMCILDADILWPAILPSFDLIEGNLYTPRRRMMTDLGMLYMATEESTWNRWPIHPQEREFAGYSQIFHASDPVLGNPPWHETNWRHGGGADSMFQRKWPDSRKIRPPFEVLHIGHAGRNWCGRSTQRMDGTVPHESEMRLRKLQSYVRGRNRRAADPYAGERIPPTQTGG